MNIINLFLLFVIHINIAIGGVILIENGKVKVHVIKPSLAKIPLQSEKELGKLVNFIELSPPSVGVGCIVSHDPVISKIIFISITCVAALDIYWKYFSFFLGIELKTSTFPLVYWS